MEHEHNRNNQLPHRFKLFQHFIIDLDQLCQGTGSSKLFLHFIIDLDQLCQGTGSSKLFQHFIIDFYQLLLRIYSTHHHAE